jgi:hypothetical protein
VTQVLASLLGGSAVLMATLPFLKAQSPWALGVVYFATWILFFTVEAAFERWFMALGARRTPAEALSLSSLSTAIIQAAVIAGPLLMAVVKRFNQNPVLPFVLIALVLVYGAWVAFLSPRAAGQSAPKPAVAAAGAAPASPQGASKLLSIAALASIWPAIAVFNMVIPILAKRYLAHGIDSAAWLEMVFGGAMAVVGFGLPALKRRYPALGFRRLVVVCGALGLALFALGYRAELLVMAGATLLGLAYGFARIEVRATLAKLYPAAVAGGVVATANAVSAPLVVLAVLLAYVDFQGRGAGGAPIVALPVVFAASLVLLMLAARQQPTREA